MKQQDLAIARLAGCATAPPPALMPITREATRTRRSQTRSGFRPAMSWSIPGTVPMRSGPRPRKAPSALRRYRGARPARCWPDERIGHHALGSATW